MNHGICRSILNVLIGLLATSALVLLPFAPTTQAQGQCVVTSAADDGSPGTLRHCLSNASAGDTITFDEGVFSSFSPATIITGDRLPSIDGGNITINGTGAGAIIDGSQLSSAYDDGFRITSNDNVIRGITIQNFPGDGVDIRDGAQGNRIKDCVIRGNSKRGVRVAGSYTVGNTITQNSITDNDGSGIVTTDGGNAELPPPIINSVVTDTNTITVIGVALPGVTVELFRDPGGEGATFLGEVEADSYGNFTFTGPLTTPLGDDNVTATATDNASGNTSMFNCYPIPIPDLIWPLSDIVPLNNGDFSSPFGPRLRASDKYRYDWHRGLDIPVPVDTPAYAVTDGRVRCAGECSGYSDPVIVQLEHEDGCYYCNYLHMSTAEVDTGDTVNQGDIVGTTGTSASGFEHLHFEIRRGGYYQRNAINPFVYLLPYADNPLSHTAVISGMYIHTASVTPTVTARVVVNAPAYELDINRLALTVTDGEEELDWRAVDFHAFNIQKSTIEHPEVLDNPYVDDICIMPARFNTSNDEYRIDFVFYGLQGSNLITLTAEAADVHSNVTSTTASQTARRTTISPNYIETRISPGMTGTLIHVLTNTTEVPHTFTVTDASAQGEELWDVGVTPESIELSNGESTTIMVTVAVSETVPIGTVDCIAIMATSEGGVEAIAVDVITASRVYLPIITKNYPP